MLTHHSMVHSSGVCLCKLLYTPVQAVKIGTCEAHTCRYGNASLLIEGGNAACVGRIRMEIFLVIQSRGCRESKGKVLPLRLLVKQVPELGSRVTASRGTVIVHLCLKFTWHLSSQPQYIVGILSVFGRRKISEIKWCINKGFW